MPPRLARRQLLATLALSSCAAPLPPPAPDSTTAAARALLHASAAAHGAPALAAVNDISVGYAGQWRPVVGALQPALVDAGHRGASQERLLRGLLAQDHTGPEGGKHVVRRTGADTEGAVRVWRDGAGDADTDRRHAAALVADGYALFLLGPMLLAGAWSARRPPGLELAAPEQVPFDGVPVLCHVLRVGLRPGLGLSPADQLALYIDAETRLTRRIRFTLDGLDGTRGATAEVDMFDHVRLRGVLWPTRFHEHLRRPAPLPVHDWRLTGLDLDRGLTPALLDGPAFLGPATPPASASFPGRAPG